MYFCFDQFIEPSHLSDLFEIHRRLLFPPEVVWTKGKIPKTGHLADFQLRELTISSYSSVLSACLPIHTCHFAKVLVTKVKW